MKEEEKEEEKVPTRMELNEQLRIIADLAALAYQKATAVGNKGATYVSLERDEKFWELYEKLTSSLS